MCQVMVHRIRVGLGSVTLNKVLLVVSGLSDPGIRNQKGEHFKSFRDGPPRVKRFLGWDVISRNSQYLTSGKPFLCLQSACSCLIEVGPQIRD